MNQDFKKNIEFYAILMDFKLSLKFDILNNLIYEIRQLYVEHFI